MELKFLVWLVIFACGWGIGRGEQEFDPQWQLLTRKNFSSQIRQHEFVLVMVTVSWSGESRALKNELVQLKKYSDKQFESLKLMLIYRNVEKHLGTVLDAKRAVNLIFYHHGAPYKYNGKLSAQNILASVWHAMTIPIGDLPLKQLNTSEDVESFLQSTDKAVLLFDICGWADKIAVAEKNKTSFSTTKKEMRKKLNQEKSLGKDGSRTVSKKSPHASQLKLTNDDSVESVRLNDFGEDKNTRSSKLVSMMADMHGFVSDKETCDIAEGSSSILSGDGLHLASYGNDSTVMETSTTMLSSGKESNRSSHENRDTLFDESSCTSEEYNYFEILYNNLSRLARDNMLPPERQKFGLISNRTVISALSLQFQDTPLIMLQFPDCPNCSKVFDRGNDLEEFVFASHPLVAELKGEGYNLMPPLSTQSLSLILFVDRASLSPTLRQRSKAALQALRQVAFQCAKRNIIKIDKSIPNSYSGREAKKKTFFPLSNNLQAQVLQSPELLKLFSLEENNIVQMKTTEGELKIVNLKGDDNLFSSPDQKILDYLLQQKPGVQLKQNKNTLSLLAKKAGFQLLSSDYVLDVHHLSQIPDTLSSLTEKTSRGSEDLNNLGRNEKIEAAELSKGLEDILDNIQKVHLVGSKDDATIAGEEQVARIGLDDTNLDSKGYESVNDHAKIQDCSTTAGEEQWKNDLSTVEAVDNNCGEKGMPEIFDSGDQVLCLKESTNQDSVVEDDTQKIDADIQKDVWPENGNGGQNQEAILQYTGDNMLYENNDEELEMLNDKQDESYGDGILFFYTDGGDQLREILSSDATIPSVVLIDPIEKKHYLFPKEISLTYSSLYDFINAFFAGTLRPYIQSEPFPPTPRESPRPPFVNRDFHEVDSTPRVTVSTFSRLVLGFDGCNETVETFCANSHSPGAAWEKDVLVLFRNDWCGFCKRLELVVREVHRFFKRCANFMHVEGEITSNSSVYDMFSFSTEVNKEKPTVDLLVNDEMPQGGVFKDEATDGFPSIFQIDCTLNDCSSLLKSMNQKEIYPKLLLFPARRKDEPIAYEGDVSVNKIVEFLAGHGSVSGHLYRLRGVLWNKMQQDTDSNTCTPRIPSSVPIQIWASVQAERPTQDLFLSNFDQYGSSHSQTGDGDKFVMWSKKPATGSILISSEKLYGTYPFENSIILLVNADPNEGFQGLIVNKPLSWDDLSSIDIHPEPILRESSINFGGPVIAKDMPFLSLTRLSNLEGFVEVLPNMYYGGPLATSKIIKMIMSGKILVHDFWFFVGFANWGWQQLYDELGAQAWHLSTYREGLFRWPAHKA